MRRQQRNRDRARAGDRARDDQGQPAAAAEKSAQQSEFFMFGVFRDEALRGRRQPEIGHAADQQHPSPSINVDAEFEAAHPAREQDLRDKCDRRAGHADDEGRARKTPYQRRVAAVGKKRIPRATARLISSPQGKEDDRRQELRQWKREDRRQYERQTERGACSEPIDATRTSAPPPHGRARRSDR